ncbi:MAG: hypothetical protein CL920_04190 [Deltaproteobacteria bacterium]|nr:hypothetical protein [Deltaproteobacteria bacterium]MBU47876.1 hypothetical protein [Deltaproteobacteria bacterium]|tara:strand:+ start:9823 stop:13302 length:3480 start_codon:yes stop_codon:yes gene_type:complete
MTELKQIGVYRIIRVLGGGGMGVVYLVEESESGSLYALKLLSPSLSPTEREFRRFRREFMTMSKLRHKHIVEVYESGVHNDSLYFVMEYAEGKELRKAFLPYEYPEQDEAKQQELLHIVNEPKRVESVLDIFQQICEALAWIHSFGIVHRDLKPENIIVTSDHRAKLLDFGIAKRLGGPEISQAQSIMGTFSYISPEQAQCLDVDGRSDLYSLGVILYELLAGRPPFMAPEPIGRLYMHLNQPAPPLREWNPYIDPGLEHVVLKLLEKDPAQRYQRAEDLHAALRSFSHNQHALATPDIAGEGMASKTSLHAPQFVGREDVFSALKERLTRQKEPIVFLSGNTGIGKTRMARELLSSARVEDVECSSVRCFPDHLPYAAYQELMEQLKVNVSMRFGRPEALWGDLGASWFTSMAQDDDNEDTLPSRQFGPGVGGKKKLFEAARHILVSVLQRVPVLFCFDDVMYIDDISLELTEYLARELYAAKLPYPFVFLGAFRNEDVGTQHSLNELMLRLAPDRLYKLYELKPLALEHVKALAESMIDASPADDSLDILMRRSLGIPFFVEELIKDWYEEGQIFETEEGWFLLNNGPVEGGESRMREHLPAAIHKRLSRRLKRLSPSILLVAEWIAVLGEEAISELLLELAGLSESELMACLDELLQQKIIVEEWTDGDERYLFAYPGIRETLYQQMGEMTRRKYHLKVAQALKRSSSRDGAFEQLARHFLSSGEDGQGAWYLLLAAEKRLREFAHRPAWDLLNRCRQLLLRAGDDVLFQPGASWWWRYHKAYLELMEYIGQYRDGLELAQFALHQISGNEEASALLRWQAVFFRHMGHYQEASECVERALAWDVSDEERLHLLQEGGKIKLAQGRYSAALESYREAMAWAVSRNDQAKQGILSGLIGQVLYQRGEFEAARNHFAKAIDLATEVGDNRAVAGALCKIGALELDEGDIKASLQRFEKAISLTRELGDRRMECKALALLGQLQSDRRLYDEGREQFELALDYAKQLGDIRGEGEFLARLGAICYFTGEHDTSRLYLEEGLQKTVYVGDHATEIWIRGFLNVVEFVLHNRNTEETIEEMERTMHMSEEIEAMEIILLCKILSGHIFRLLNQRGRALDQLTAARYLAIEIGNRRMLAKIESERYLLDKHKGRVWGLQQTL